VQGVTSIFAQFRDVTASGCMGVSNADAAVLCGDVSGNSVLESATVERDISCTASTHGAADFP
jgi:hypothetical protein